MLTITANAAKARFDEFLNIAQREPVRVLRHERVIGVMVSAQDFEAMRVFLREPASANTGAKFPAGEPKPSTTGCVAG